ncbi:ribosome silencing factor [Rickettsiaceae bacterium]|nr:ribosome silencing factor [Rickettsiaceae bacterium]
MTSKGANQLKDFIIKHLAEKKMEDIQCLDVRNKTSVADYMVFASGKSRKNIKAIADYISLELKHEWRYNVTPEGGQDTDWILIDAGSVVVNLLHPDAREKLNLEEFWRDKYAQAG